MSVLDEGGGSSPFDWGGLVRIESVVDGGKVGYHVVGVR